MCVVWWGGGGHERLKRGCQCMCDCGRVHSEHTNRQVYGPGPGDNYWPATCNFPIRSQAPVWYSMPRLYETDGPFPPTFGLSVKGLIGFRRAPSGVTPRLTGSKGRVVLQY